MKKYLILFFAVAFTINSQTQTMTDIEGNVYNIVTIGSQVWMKENLKTTKYNDGSVIPENNTEFLSTPAFTWYNDSSSYKTPYGALYNWYVVETGMLCPTGWHVPTSDEWTILATFLGGDSIAGGKLKESGLNYWNSPNTGADNSTGFSALPGGQRFPGGGYFSIGNVSYFWSSSQSQSIGNGAWVRQLSYYNNYFIPSDHPVKSCGFSVRCLKDNSTSVAKTNEKNTDIRLYPNPANKIIYIQNTLPLNTNITIYNMLGKKIMDKTIQTNEIDITELSKGIYFFKFNKIDNDLVYKFIKE